MITYSTYLTVGAFSLFLLRCLWIGLAFATWMNLLTVGMVNDIFVENQNDDYEYDEVADQADFDAF